jgi:hypothetical protein
MNARTFITCMFLLAGFECQAHAAIPVPTVLSPGDPYHLVFVSSTAHDTNFGGLSGADAYVQALADAAGIGVTEGVTWKALLSDKKPTDAISRFNPSAPVYNMHGDRIAANGAALWGTTTTNLENPVAYDEYGNGSTTILIEVWTGTNPDGTYDLAKSNWQAADNDGTATAGSSIAVNTDWMTGGGYPVETVPLSLFAFSDQLIVPVPEPTALMLAAIGLSSLVVLGRQRRGHG